MNNLFKYIGLTTILLFGFYYTEKMSNMVIFNSELVSKIVEEEKNYEYTAIDAIIDGDYIIPGLNGNNINVIKSYNNMKAIEVFNSHYLVYDLVIPSISLENNKDKIIKNGNVMKNAVAIIVEDNEDVINYATKNNIKVSRLINIDTYNKFANYEQINHDFTNFSDMELLLNKHNQNKDICYITGNNKDLCLKEDKYLVEATITLNNANLANVKNAVSSGYIIKISNSVDLTDFKILLRQICYKDLVVIGLSELITEERD